MSEVSKEQLDEIIKRQKDQESEIAKLQKDNKELRGLASEKTMDKVKEVTQRTAELRMLDDRIVMGFKNRGTERRPRYIYSKPDPLDPKTQINFVDVILEAVEDGEEEVMTVKHNEFLEEAERVVSKIVNIKEQPWVINQGQTRKKEVDGHSLIELDMVVDLDVKGVTRTYELELPSDFDNRKVTVYEDYINM